MGEYSQEGGGTLPQNSLKKPSLRNFTLKKSHIGSVVSDMFGTEIPAVSFTIRLSLDICYKKQI